MKGVFLDLLCGYVVIERMWDNARPMNSAPSDFGKRTTHHKRTNYLSCKRAHHMILALPYLLCPNNE